MYGPRPTLVSHHPQDSPEQQLDLLTLLHSNSELLAQIALSSSTCQVVLQLLPLVLFYQCGCLSFCPLRAGWVFPGVTAKCVRMSNRHLLIISVPGFHKHISCTSLNSSSFPLFDSLCLSDSVFGRLHPCVSRQDSLNDRSDSLSAFIAMWLCRFSMRCKRCTSWEASRVSVSFNVRRQDVESSGFSFKCSFNHNPWQWKSRSFFVSCDFHLFWSSHLPRSATQTFPIRRFPSISVCLVQLLPHTTPFLVKHVTAPVRS